VPGPSPDPVACVLGDIDLVRPLGLAGIPCAVVARGYEPPWWSRFAVARLERFDAWQEQDAQVVELLRFAAGRAEPPVVFYGGDPELLLVHRHRERLAGAFRFVVPDAELVDDVLDKARFAALAERLDLPVPRARRLRPRHEPPPVLELAFPLLVKPITRHNDVWRPVAGEAKALRVDDAAGLRDLWDRLAAGDLEVLAQELVPGPETRVESYHVYVDAAGEVAGEFCGRKIRTLPAEFGHSTALTSVHAPDVAALGRELVARIGLRGLAKLDFKRTPAGDLRLLEVNPRFSLWHHLGALAGVNLPAIVFADLTGRPRPPRAEARPGVRWSMPWRDLVAARQAGVPLRAWLRWTARVEAKSGLAWDDPMPFVAGRLLKRLARRGAPAAP